MRVVVITLSEKKDGALVRNSSNLNLRIRVVKLFKNKALIYHLNYLVTWPLVTPLFLIVFSRKTT